MILTSSAFLNTTSFLLTSLRDAERDLVVRLSITVSAAVREGLERFDPRAVGCESFPLFFKPDFFVVAFLSPASVFVAALEDTRADGLDVSASSFGLALTLRPRLGLVAAVLVDAVDFFFFVSFGAASFASVSPVTLATSPCVHQEELSWNCGQ